MCPACVTDYLLMTVGGGFKRWAQPLPSKTLSKTRPKSPDKRALEKTK
jgi:hypothetical protein